MFNKRDKKRGNNYGYNKKYEAYKFGLFAELITVLFLSLKGYKILKKRYKTKVGEIDIIAKKGKNIVMIEVKARKDKDIQIDEVIGAFQMKRIVNASKYYLAKHSNFASYGVRFDLIIISPFSIPKHFRNIVSDINQL